MSRLTKILGMLALALAVAVAPLLPQASSSTAELRGEVSDPSGAAVPGANVTLTDPAKGLRRSVVTDGEGNYAFLDLLPSLYELKVESAGFARSMTRIQLSVGEQANLAIGLNLQRIDESISVIEAPAIIDTGRTDQSSTVRAHEINNLPINRRNYLDYALLTPGLNSSGAIVDSFDPRAAQQPQSGLSFGGSNGRFNYFSVDGGETNTSTGAVVSTVGQEAVQEFQVIRNSYNVEFGGSSGGVVNIVSKSGSNALHGTAFALFRDKKLDARNAFDFSPHGGSPFRRQQYGGSLGGPIRKDRTFFFAAVERVHQNDSSFVNLLNDTNMFQITPSQTSLFNFLEAGTPFAAAATELRATLTTTAALYPRTMKLFTDATGQFPFNSNQTTFSARVDHTWTERDYAYVRFNLNDAIEENQAAGALTAVSRSRTLDTLNGGILLSEDHQFSGATLNELKVQFSDIQFTVIPKDRIGPALDIEGFGLFGRDLFLPSRKFERHYDLVDNLSRISGKHTLKFGGAFLSSFINTYDELFFGGRFVFGSNIPLTAIIASNPALGQALLTQMGAFLAANRPDLLTTLQEPINSLQAFDLNLPIVYQGGLGDPKTHAWTSRYSIYAQDIWKARPNFTLNYGVRESLSDEPFFVPFQEHLQPRAGFSWDPFSDGRTALRGGAGIYTGSIIYAIPQVTTQLNGSGDPTNINIVLATATSHALGLPTSFTVYQTLLAQGVLGKRLITAADLAQFGIVPRAGAPLEVRFRLDPNYQSPTTYQSSFGIQRDLGAGFSLEADYLFTRGVHLPRNRDVNLFKQTGPTNPITGQPTFIRFPTAAQLAAGLTSDFRVPLRLQDNQYESTANSFYHAFMISAQKRFSKNYSINAHYTLSKTIDELTDFNSDFSAQNPLNLRADRALSAFDQRHRAVVDGVFASPYRGESRSAKILADWIFAPIFTAASARPFNLLLGFDANGDGRSTTDRAGTAGRNTGKGKPFYSLDARLARRFTLRKEGRYLELSLDGFNLLNRTNLIGINNVVGSNHLTTFAVQGDRTKAPTQPLGFTSAAPARQLQVGIRVNF